MTIETISDFEAFVAMPQLWDRLVDEAGIRHPFLCHDWIRSWWESFGAGNTLNILLVRDGKELIGIAPLMSSGRKLGFICDDHTPRFDFIVSRDQTGVCEAIWRRLWEQHDDWDSLQLCQLESDSTCLREFRRLAGEHDCLLGLWPSAKSPYLPLTGSFRECVAASPRGMGSNLKKGLNRLEKQGPVEFERFSDIEQIERALDDVFEMEASCWKGAEGTALVCNPETKKFYSLAAWRAARSGILSLTFLKLNGKRIAFDLSLIYKNTLFKLKPGYSVEYQASSPGSQLTARIIEDAFGRGLTEIDFLGAADAWKLDWTKHARQHYWAFIYPGDLRGSLAYHAKFRLAPWLKGAA
jgi:CelD/BcsL family acetyltransferase involved in cellulose biosynthesis